MHFWFGVVRHNPEHMCPKDYGKTALNDIKA